MGFSPSQKVSSKFNVRHESKFCGKNPMNASTRLSTNGKSPITSSAPPFFRVLLNDDGGLCSSNLEL
jgi:hypothetical protein